jgi:hypothetical protein
LQLRAAVAKRESLSLLPKEEEEEEKKTKIYL